MTLLEQIMCSPRYLRNGLGDDSRNIVVCALPQTMRQACEAIHVAHPASKILAHCYPSNSKGDGGFCPELAIRPASLPDYPNCDILIYWDKCLVPDVLYHPEAAQYSPVIYPRVRAGQVGRRYAPDLYKEHKDELEAIFQEIADAESRAAFVSVVKALITGEIEWIKPSSFREYEHPDTLARPGDIIIDAGLFDSTVLRRFALAAGPAGHVHGFEPEPSNYDFVLSTLERYGNPGNITVIKKGVWSQKGKMRVNPDGASSEIGTIGNHCEVIDIDSYVEENDIGKVDLIKMDIEGAELNALQGASRTIRRNQPRLHISAYHRVGHIWQIPAMIKDLGREYKIHFAAHVPFMNEYVYYFEPRF